MHVMGVASMSPDHGTLCVYSVQVYLSLIPIVVGVLMASVTEVQFNATGLAWAMVSTFFSALINVWAKKVIERLLFSSSLS